VVNMQKQNSGGPLLQLIDLMKESKLKKVFKKPNSTMPIATRLLSKVHSNFLNSLSKPTKKHQQQANSYSSIIIKATLILLLCFCKIYFTPTRTKTLILFLCFYTYYFTRKRTKIALIHDTNPANTAIISELTYLHNSHYSPSFWLPSNLLQIIFGNLEPFPNVIFHRENIKLSDGGQVCIDWAYPLKQIHYTKNPHKDELFPYNPPDNNKIMFVIHGLTGGSETQYIQYLVREAQLQGYRVAAFNHRGINQPLVNPYTSHGGDLTDLEKGIDYVRTKFPEAPMVAAGTSFGGNQLMRYLAKKGDDSEFLAAVSIAGPFDIGGVVDAIEGTIYERAIANKFMKINLIPNVDVLKSLEESHGIDFNKVLSSKTIREYHERFTIKLYSHKDVADYFRTTHVDAKTIANISTPLLCLHAQDDPIVVREGIPFDALKSNKNIIFAETSQGSHLSWFTGWLPKRWYPKPTLQYLEVMMKIKSSSQRLGVNCNTTHPI